VPDIRNPFLGVHFTKSVSGDVYLGPTAIPVFKRENHGLIRGIGLEAINILYRDAVLLIANPKFREIALTEPQKYFFRDFFKDAKALVKKFRPEDVIPPSIYQFYGICRVYS
jgi:L-2-hydroxyglutarate oxidase LhgO